MTRARLRASARRILRAGLAAVEPGRLVANHLESTTRGVRVGGVFIREPRRLFVVAVGKAAVPMARAAHRILGRRITNAILIAPAPAPPMPRTLRFVAGHPLPDGRGVRAAARVIRMLEDATKGDLILLLLSGGASALMPAPVPGITLAQKRRVTQLLLKRGAGIDELNAVRGRLSRLKNGGFARLAAPARVLTLAISDVPGDDPRTIGSGPTVDDRPNRAKALKVLRRFALEHEVPEGVLSAVRAATRSREAKGRSRTFVIGSGRTFAEAAAKEARRLGFRTLLEIGALRGEARACAPRLVKRFARFRKRSACCLIATGETVVQVRGKGRGGRNQELALASVRSLHGFNRPTVLAAFATDGVDGASKASGGLVDDTTALRAIELRVDVEATLDKNDSSRALRRLESLVDTGPTGTNVADITLLLG